MAGCLGAGPLQACTAGCENLHVRLEGSRGGAAEPGQGHPGQEASTEGPQRTDSLTAALTAAEPPGVWLDELCAPPSLRPTSLPPPLTLSCR